MTLTRWGRAPGFGGRQVGPGIGYRYYEAAQLARLNRIVALKHLGLRLDAIRSILEERVSVEQLRGMLPLRRSELESQLTDTAIRLRQVEARLRVIEEGDMNEVVPTAQALARWIEANGYVSAGYAREVSLHVQENLADWVIELQEPVIPGTGLWTGRRG